MSFLTRSTITALGRRSYATLTTPNTLILLEHKSDAIVPATLNAITAAKKLGGNLTALIVGEEGETKAVVEKAKKWVLSSLAAIGKRRAVG